MQNPEAKAKVMNIISKSRITKRDVIALVDATLEAKPVMKLKDRMSRLIEEGLTLTNNLPKRKLRSKLQILLSFMLEGL
jgi:hypothetical protein